jgi:hypothetical protein
MGTQLTSNAEALRLFFTEDIYLVAGRNPVQDKVVPQKPLTEFKFLGKNQKHVLILVNDPVNDVSTEQGRELLRKLVKAIDLTANDFALVNYSQYTSAKYQDLNAFFDCKLMIAFGVAPAELDLPAQTFHELVAYHEATHVFAKNLHDLDADLASKKILWASLQQLKI